MSEDREQDRTRGRKDASRPVTAAARRERRASARAGASAEGTTARSSSASAATGQQRAAGSGAARAKASTEKKGRPTPSREREERRPSVFARLARFLREVVAELRKVIWPTRKQLVTYTAVVLVFVAFMVAFIFGLDVVFREAIFWVFA